MNGFDPVNRGPKTGHQMTARCVSRCGGLWLTRMWPPPISRQALSLLKPQKEAVFTLRRRLSAAPADRRT